MINPFAPFVAAFKWIVGIEERTVAHVIADFTRVRDDLKAIEQRSVQKAVEIEQDIVHLLELKNLHRVEEVKARAVAAQIDKLVNPST